MAVVEDQFPVGMRVLAVDDDPICLKVLENLLRKCQYHVTTTNQAVTALKMLRENRSKYDLVISDVNMPDMDGFKLLELVGLEIDLPVIMLSSHSDKDLVYKGVTHGAVDYLLKPVRMEELKNIWQHVIRKKKLFPRDPTRSQNEGDDNDRNGEGLQGVASSGSLEQCGKANRKRKDQEEDEDEQDEDNEEDNEENGTQKKPRVVWSVDLHQKFVQSVDQLGLDKAVPKKILDLMNVEGLTRENVASHLQKYRLYLKKLSNQSAQSANMAAAFGAKDPCFLRPDGFGDFRSLVNPGRFSGSSISSYPPGGMLGRMNTSSGLSFRGMASSSLFQPSQSQSQSQSQSLGNPSFGKLQPGLLPATQVTNLFQGVPTSLDSNQLQRKSAANFGEFNCNSNVTGFPIGNNFPDSNVVVSGLGNTVSSMPSNAMMFQLKQQNGQSGGQFPTQAPLNMPSLNQNSFGVGFNGSSSFVDHSTSNQSWHGPHGAAQLSSFPSNSLLLRDSFSHDPLPAGNNTGINFSSPGALPAHLDNSRVNMQGQASLIGNVVHNMNHTSSQRWEEHNQDYNARANSTFINMDSLLSGNGAGPSTVDPRKKFDSSVVGQLNNGTSSVLQHSAEDTNMMSGDEGLLQQSKSPDGYIQNNYDFDDLMNSMMKREQGETLLGDAEFTFDGYNLGPCM